MEQVMKIKTINYIQQILIVVSVAITMVLLFLTIQNIIKVLPSSTLQINQSVNQYQGVR